MEIDIGELNRRCREIQISNAKKVENIFEVVVGPKEKWLIELHASNYRSSYQEIAWKAIQCTICNLLFDVHTRMIGRVPTQEDMDPWNWTIVKFSMEEKILAIRKKYNK